ncbi:hypothetical protein NLJ89_g12008 [Agrocybe chaxingu]|uniref:Uncharacterized protein n=1 Tax=Agrocybe chaxingu TaxID=84603 RepID=A0A9W8JVP5_9AGAR|nr:hypothetical protein NLJ89_g12008 [Agrocybe chaxingu]
MPRVPTAKTAKTSKPAAARRPSHATESSISPRKSPVDHVNSSESSTKENKCPLAPVSSHHTMATTTTFSSLDGSEAVVFGPKTETDFIIEKYRIHPSRFTIRMPKGAPKRATTRKRERRHHENKILKYLKLNNLEHENKDLGASYVCR